MIRFGVIGTNFITDRFLNAALECRGLKFCGVYSRNIEKAKQYAKKYCVEKVYDDLNHMAKDEEIDAVYIASPNSAHYMQSVLMLSHKKHVLCEKTIASNARELDIMLKTAHENNVVLLEAMRPVFDIGFQKIIENLPKLGKIRKAHFEYCQYSSRYDNFKKGVIENAFRPELSNGALMDIGVYCVHSIMKLFGRPKKIMASAIKLENGIDAEGVILMEYDHMLAEASYSKITDSCVYSQIQGEKGQMLIDTIHDPRVIKIHKRDGGIETIETGNYINNMNFEVEQWVSLIENNEVENEHNTYSVLALSVMDEARKQMGIVFPADK